MRDESALRIESAKDESRSAKVHTADNCDELAPEARKCQTRQAEDEREDYQKGRRLPCEAPEEDGRQRSPTGGERNDDASWQAVRQPAEEQEARNRGSVHERDERGTVWLALDLARVTGQPDCRNKLKSGIGGRAGQLVSDEQASAGRRDVHCRARSEGSSPRSSRWAIAGGSSN